MKKRGTWISITGIDGAGKTTLGRYMNEKVKDSVFIHLPYYEWVRDMLKVSGRNKPFGDTYTDMLIFAASGRLENYLLNEMLAKHNYVISQRSWIDNFAYRAVQGFSAEEIIKIQKSEKLLIPNIIIFIKVDYRVAFNRIKDTKGDKYEDFEFMEKLQAEFEKLFSEIISKKFVISLEDTKIYALDGSKTFPELKFEIDKIITDMQIEI